MPSPCSLDASVAGFSTLVLPPRSAVQGCKFDCSLCPSTSAVCRRLARSTRASLASLSWCYHTARSAVQGCKFYRSLCPSTSAECRRRARSTCEHIAGFSNEPALLPPSAVWGCNCDRSPFLWLRLCPIAVLSMAGNEVCARYRGATRRPLRDVPCGARYRRRRRGWASFHFLTSAASMGDSLCCMLGCSHIPMCGLRALGPHVMERDPRLLFRCSGAFAGSLRRMGRVVLYA